MSTRPAQEEGEGPLTVLITGGRAPAALELARLWSAAGHRVITADSIPRTLCGASRRVAGNYVLPEVNDGPQQYIEALADVIQRERVHMLIPTCEEVFAVSRFRERLLPLCQVLVDEASKLSLLHNKWEFIDTAKRLGFRVPETRLLTSAGEVQAFLEEGDPLRRYVLKPVFSRFASKVRIVRGGEAAGDIQVSSRYPWVGQQFIEGKPYCTYGIAHDGRLTAHAAYASKFTAGQGACVCFEREEHSGLQEWVACMVSAIRFTGQIAFDFIETEDGALYPLECNPRATSGIHLFRAEDRLDRAFLDTASDSILTPSGNRPTVLKGAMLLYAWKGMSSLPRARDWMRAVFRGRDAVFRWDDPAPLAAQWPMLLHFWRKSRKHGISIAEATTIDMEWNGER